MDYEEIRIKDEPDFFESEVKSEYDITELEDPLAINENEYEKINEEIKSENLEDNVQFEVIEIAANNEQSNVGRLFNCSVCKEFFLTRNELSEHSFQHVETLYCAYCWKTFYSKRTLKSHLKYHLYLLRNLECKICTKKFKSQVNFDQHVAKFHEKKNYVEGQIPTYIQPTGIKCAYCEREFFNTNAFEKHMFQDHRGLPQDALNGPFACTVCGQNYENLDELKKHIKVHSVKEKYQCGICNQIVRTKKEIRDHLVKSHKQTEIPMKFPYVLKLVTCPITGKTAPEKLNSSATSNNKCPYCPRAFVRTSTLEKHMSTEHQGLPFDAINGPFFCTICAQPYDILNDLKKHVKKHFVVDRYQCGFCDRMIYKESQIRRHVDKKHPEHALPLGFPDDWKLVKRKPLQHTMPYKCHICNRSFSRKDHLVGHIQAHNLGHLKYKCKICGMAFLKFDVFVRRHVKQHLLTDQSMNPLIHLPSREAKDLQTDTKFIDSPRIAMSFLEENTNADVGKQNEFKKSVNSLFHLLKKAQDAKKVTKKRDPQKSTIVSVKTEIKVEDPED